MYLFVNNCFFFLKFFPQHRQYTYAHPYIHKSTQTLALLFQHHRYSVWYCGSFVLYSTVACS